MSKEHFRVALTDTTAEYSTDIRDVTTQIDDVCVFVSFSSRMRNLSIACFLSMLVSGLWCFIFTVTTLGPPVTYGPILVLPCPR